MKIPKFTEDIDERVRLCKGFSLIELASYVEAKVKLDPGEENGRLANWLVKRIAHATEHERSTGLRGLRDKDNYEPVECDAQFDSTTGALVVGVILDTDNASRAIKTAKISLVDTEGSWPCNVGSLPYPGEQ